ncbi:hypothetical protein FM109_17390 [Vibrio casei]|nr:hypothetical protein FM109_17390 [Vibrio casei]
MSKNELKKPELTLKEKRKLKKEKMENNGLVKSRKIKRK